MTARQTGGGEDRLSNLPDKLLGHILSFLPTDEAARAAVLSSRYRYMFAHVHTLSFQDDQDYNFWGDAITFYMDSEERRSVNGDFLDEVNAAILSRRRCAGLARNATLRSFSLGINYYYDWDEEMVHGWIRYALRECGQELHLDLRLHTHEPCGGYSRGDSEDHFSFEFPSALFSCAALRSLRLGYCCLDPPEDVALPSLETLHLTAVQVSEENIHGLVSSCPRLVDLTLESCSTVTRVFLPDKRLRRFALRCCHNTVRVVLDASELRVLDYRGAVPAESLFAFRGSPRLRSYTVGFCGTSSHGEADEYALFLHTQQGDHSD